MFSIYKRIGVGLSVVGFNKLKDMESMAFIGSLVLILS